MAHSSNSKKGSSREQKKPKGTYGKHKEKTAYQRERDAAKSRNKHAPLSAFE